MRSPHNPQPNLSLGDDPDPASELGPRLAATSQTVQGLLTNYLFYGQRRSNDPAPAGVQRLGAERRHEAQDEHDRSSMTSRTHGAAGSQPADRPEVLSPAHEASLQPAGSLAEGTEASRLQLVLRPDRGANSAEQSLYRTQTTAEDPLARDALTNDPVGRDPLRLSAGRGNGSGRPVSRGDRPR